MLEDLERSCEPSSSWAITRRSERGGPALRPAGAAALGHSYSVFIHRVLGNDAYRLIELEPEELEPFLGRGDIGGLNVTDPLQARGPAVLPDALSRGTGHRQRQYHRARTDGKLRGHNTDAYGFAYTVRWPVSAW
jgi:shikimate 5-dehydrogenase